MSNYTIVLSKKVQKQLDKFTDDIAKPILESIEDLKDDPRPAGVKKLKGRDGYRVRVGSYRVIYEIVEYELIVDVIAVGHRKDIYD
jgi:mRNA interferase RelE/StbE